MFRVKHIISLMIILTIICTPVRVFCEENNSDLFKEKNNVAEVMNYDQDEIILNDSDVYLIAQVVCGESRSEPYKGKLAVASVILNRLKSPQFPKSVSGVIKQKGAFSCVVNGHISQVPDEDSYRAVLEALKGNDPTSKAVFFYNPKIATNTWMIDVDKKNLIKIGNHVFFNVP